MYTASGPPCAFFVGNVETIVTPKSPIMLDIKTLKRQAKALKRQHQCTHMQALECIAHEQGFENWHALLRFTENSHRTNLRYMESVNTQRMVLEVPFYSSVPVGWLTGRNTYSTAIQHQQGQSAEKSNELEVPVSCWKTN
ncbi:glyoxalase superfamily protein [Enterovibrio nigricans]|uniref:Glyoxalase-related protein domain-containing protein n=1 Tax=Enterovibrio nigricans DSM 22720 TaxID=1121868 RepID=A0A1T4VHS1_9GAMM|nr:glyoxalase superfamily protein [Enterovibrio nigricans]PKF49653.1 hypothetical protein AT251_17390 [Enterovibrio nigricans]SKA64463.1 hypothetical protein SAMN02745132_03860 [Enterovibrio nigricans DSM 22720]